MSAFHVTVRYGSPSHRYQTLDVDAEDIGAALTEIRALLSPQTVETADLIEVRRGVDPESREFLGE